MITQVINKIIDNDIGYSFVKSKIAVISTIVFLTILICSTFAELIAPYNPFDPVTVSLLAAFTPPVWIDGGSTNFVLGTDQQGRDMLSTMNNGGNIAFLGIPSKPFEIDWSQLVFKGVTVKGIYGREMFETWYKMASMLQSGLDISPVLTHELSVDDFQDGFDIMESGNCGKVVLEW